ncbi:hypothetical protein B0H17DRAFT_1035507 [Mycena rosella]|uniref:Pentatricopeptide repeat-containing protein-mitochondrial domain-containing protein n=1 Tax=Mycena rosella TaxID=1033263 RepID=A0AAD7M905_MYCRO|nr:hypothetical protein B0H17DRAFT_1035507 [Mycena rosella]
MLRRAALAFKLDPPSQQLCHFVPSFTFPPCRFLPSLHSSTCIRYMAVFSASHVVSNERSRVQDHPVVPSPGPNALYKLFVTVPQNRQLVKKLQADPKIHGVLYDLASSRTLNVARQLGSPPDLSAYETIAHRLGVLKEWDLLLHVVSSAWHNTHKATHALLDWRARALLETKHYTNLNRIFDSFEANNIIPSRSTWHLVLSGYIRNNDLAGARECMSRMEAAGIPADYSTHALVGTLYRTIGPDVQVKERAIEALPHIPAHKATAMMNSLMKLRLDLHNLDESKVGPLLVMLATSRTQRADNTQNQDIDHSSFPVVVAPDATTFAMFIDYFAHLHELPRCLAILDHMLAVGIVPTHRVLTSLIRAYFLVGHGGAAVRLVAAMCRRKIQPTKHLPSPEEYDLPFDVTRLGQPTRAIFNCLLRAVLRTHGLAGGRAVLQMMSVNHIIASHSAKVEGAQPGLVMRMIRHSSARITLQDAHIVLASTLRVQKFLVHGMGWDTVAANFSPIQFVSHSEPNFDPIGGIVLPSRLRQQGIFRAMKDSLVERGIKSDKATFALRMRHEAVIRGDMNAATDAFQTMLSRGLHPNQYHYSALMEGFATTGDFESALEVMKSASRASFEPDVLMFTILIVGYARRKNPDMALRIFRRMVDAGIKPDVPAIDAVASAFFVVGAYNMCWRVLTELWKYISPLPPDIDQTSLHSAAVYFRSLHQEQQGRKKMSKVLRTALYKDLKLLYREWKRFERRDPGTDSALTDVDDLTTT